MPSRTRSSIDYLNHLNERSARKAEEDRKMSRACLDMMYEEEWERLDGTFPSSSRLATSAYEWAALRFTVFERDKNTCSYCGEIGGLLECDHVVPVVAGGTEDIDNLATACRRCNRSKGSKSLAQWVRS